MSNTETSTEVQLVDHERRITTLEALDKWSLRALLFLATLKFFGIDNIAGMMSLFGIQIGVPHH